MRSGVVEQVKTERSLEYKALHLYVLSDGAISELVLFWMELYRV
jgi:hypothetical protein